MKCKLNMILSKMVDPHQKQVPRGEEAEGKPDCFEGGFLGERECQSEERCRGGKRCSCPAKDGGGTKHFFGNLKCSFFKVAILREKMARFEAGIFSQPGNK